MLEYYSGNTPSFENNKATTNNNDNEQLNDDLVYMNQNLEGVSSVNTISSNYFSQVRTRSIIEPDFLYDKKYRLTSVDPELKMDFSRILNKPYFIKNIVWTNTSAQFAVIDVTRIPLDIFNNALAKIPFEASTLYRAKMSILLQVAGTPMHQGILIAAAMPIGFASDPTYTGVRRSLNSLMAAPHVFLNANEQTSTRLRVPFYVNSPLDKTDLDRTTYNLNFTGTDYAAIPIMVLNPLGVPTSGSASVSVSMHVVFDDIEFYAPHTDVSYVPVPALEAQGLMEDLKSAGTKAIDGAFSTVRKLTGDLFDVARSGVRQYTGLHSPNFPMLQSKTYIQSRNVANVTDVPVRFDKMDNFGNFDRVVKDFIYETAQDEMDIKYLGTKPQYLGTFVVKTTDSPGVLCWSRPITPAQEFSAASYVNFAGETINTSSFTNLQQLLAYVHRYWRGGIKIHLQANMTNFHFCKLAIARDYSVRTQGVVSYPTFASIPNLMTEFVEFSAGGQIQTISLPFVSQMSQLPCTNDWQSNSSQHGMYYIYLNQPLVTNGSVPTNISFNVYISLDDDFQFFGYAVNPLRIDYPNSITRIPTRKPPDEEEGLLLKFLTETKSITSDLSKLQGIELEAQASAPVPESIQEELTASALMTSNVICPDFRPVTNMRDHMRRFYKVFRRGYTSDTINSRGSLITLDVADLLGQRTQLIASPVSNTVGSTLDLLSKLYLGCSGGARFKIVISGTSTASAWFVPPGIFAGRADGDAVSFSTIPISRSVDPNAYALNHIMFQNLIDSSTSTDTSFSAQAPILERANYAVSAGNFSAYNSAGGDVNYVPDSTSILEFEVPNMSPYKFYGDVTKVSRVSSAYLAQSSTCALGHIVIYIPPMSLTNSIRVGANVAVYASYDDVVRHGYQVFIPSVIIPAYKDGTSTNWVGADLNYPLGFVDTGPKSTSAAISGQDFFYNFYTKLT